MENTENDALKKECIACCELINKEASVCHYCNSPQKHRTWILIGDVFKWVGSFTVVVTLVVGMLQVNTIYKKWSEKQQFLEQLVVAAEDQIKLGDKDSAWEMLEEAIKVNPSSLLVREKQLALAMELLRNISTIRHYGDDGCAEVIRLMKLLHKGVGLNKDLAADVYAHLGWGGYLRRTRYLIYYEDGVIGYQIADGDSYEINLNVDGYFDRAIELDKDNFYAHSMKPLWIARGRYLKNVRWHDVQPSDLVEVMKNHFSIALKEEQGRDFVRVIQRLAYDSANDAPLAYEYVRTMIEMKKNNEIVSEQWIKNLLVMYRKAIQNDAKGNPELIKSILLSVSEDDTKMLLSWLQGLKGITIDKEIYLKIIQGRLAENRNDLSKALSIYDDVYKDVKDTAMSVRYDLPVFVKRICASDNVIKGSETCNQDFLSRR